MNKTNVVIIMTDQHRADLRKKEGYPIDTMPFLDQFAETGADFAKAYTSCPACVPARVSMFTGRFPSATHVKSNLNSQDAFYSVDLVDILRGCGYKIGVSGKNHSQLRREDLDFAAFFDHLGGHKQPNRTQTEKDFDAHLKKRGHETAMVPTPFPLELQCPYRIVSLALDWIDSLASQPFFLWLSFPEPHNPYQVPEPYFSMFPLESLPPLATDEQALAHKGYKYQYMRRRWEESVLDVEGCIRRTRTNYHGMLRLIDDQLARFVTTLQKRGLLDNTIVVFVSDHGDFVGEYGLMRKGPEMPEVLTRIPMIFTGPGIVPQRQQTAHVSIVDIMPTVCEAVGAKIPAGVQGRSLWPLLTGADYPEREFSSVYAEHGIGGRYIGDDDPEDVVRNPAPDAEFPPVQELNSRTQSGFQRMLRRGDWKLLYDMEGNGQLYNLTDDPFEVNNRFGEADLASIQADLMEELLRWVVQMQDTLPHPRERLVVKVRDHGYRS